MDGLTVLAHRRHLHRNARRMLAGYDLRVRTLRLIHDDWNTVFRVTAEDGRNYVLRLYRVESAYGQTAEHARSRIDSELWWMDRLRADLGLTVPAAVLSSAGQAAGSVLDPAGGPPIPSVVFHWIAGRFSRTALTTAQIGAVGRLTARLHNHSETLLPPPSFLRDSVEDLDMNGLMSTLTTRDRLTAEAGLARALASARSLGNATDVFGVIHADIHQHNYLFHRGEVRLIDFGDCGWGHYLYDLAVTVQGFLGSARYGLLRAGLITGYREIRALVPEHEGLIDDFLILRILSDAAATQATVYNQSDETIRAITIRRNIASVRRLLEASGDASR